MLCKLPKFALGRLLAVLAIAGITVCPSASADEQAEAVLSDARDRLMTYPSLTAEVVQQAELPSGRCQSSGRYVAGAFPKLRVEMDAELGPLAMHTIDVCDGQVLWSVRELRSVSDPTEAADIRVSRRDIERIRQELAAGEQTPRQTLAAELGVGGLPALLAGLQDAFEFTEQSGDAGTRLLVGRWKADSLAELKLAKAGDRIPKEVRLTLDAATLVPTRVLYVGDRDGEPYAIMNVEFRNFSAEPIEDEAIFRYTPPREVEIDNRTDTTLRAIRGEPS